MQILCLTHLGKDLFDCYLISLSCFNSIFYLHWSTFFVPHIYFLITVLPTVVVCRNNGLFAVVWHENPQLSEHCKAHGQENYQFLSVESTSKVTQAKVAFCLLTECAFVTFLHGATLLQLLRNIAWDPEVVKKMKWDSAAQGRCTRRDIPSPKYQSSELRRLFISMCGSKKRYWQHKNTGNSVVLALSSCKAMK